MCDKKDPFSELRRLIQENPERVTILEEEIDLKLQMEFYRLTREIRKNAIIYTLDTVIDELFNSESEVAIKKKMLSILASFTDVAALRAIERYRECPDEWLEKWAVLAYQSSRMLISSKLLDSVPVFISTGLGGKERKLRYSVGMSASSGNDLNEFQQKIVLSEMEFLFKKDQAVIEEIEFYENIVLFTFLIPIEADVRQLLNQSIVSINQFGSFLKESFMITNMQKITFEQMKAVLLTDNNTNENYNITQINDDEE